MKRTKQEIKEFLGVNSDDNADVEKIDTLEAIRELLVLIEANTRK